MSGKYNKQHNRSMSKYPERLKKRGLTSKSVRMESLEALRKRQGFHYDEIWSQSVDHQA